MNLAPQYLPWERCGIDPECCGWRVHFQPHHRHFCVHLSCLSFHKMRISALWCFSEPEVSSLLKYSSDEEHVTVLDLSYSRFFHWSDLLMEDACFANVETSRFPREPKFQISSNFILDRCQPTFWSLAPFSVVSNRSVKQLYSVYEELE